MKIVTPLHAALESLPVVALQTIPDLAGKCDELLSEADISGVRHLYITGCGDSYHAGVAASLVFQRFSALHTVSPLPAMQFARYQASFLPPPESGLSLVIGISVSGQVSRTAEALELARRAGARTLAITANLDGPLAEVAGLILSPPPSPPAAESQDLVLPGATSFITSMIALFQIALHLGRLKGRLTGPTWREEQNKLLKLAGQMPEVFERNDQPAARYVNSWAETNEIVYCGSGPNYGTAMFSAAKLIEASGDNALAQDLEEWAHLQYFGRDVHAPTILISGGARDAGRAIEIATAARAIGRNLAIIAPSGSPLAETSSEQELMATGSDTDECYHPLQACLPGLLIAAHRARQLDEPYFRGFGGGRSLEGGGGISRIRDSDRIHKLP
jgi:glucosamine--fructose-6-phosphate aminotransferase (isomerizing)